MKSICLYLQIHQPVRLKRYRFFEIGNDHYYFDDFANEDIVCRVAERSYLPTVRTLLEMSREYGDRFKCAINITGTAIEQLQQYVPEFIDLLKQLADSGCVEFTSCTYSHSLVSVENPDEFVKQVRMHDQLIYSLFGQRPQFFLNTELIYDDDMASRIADMGFRGVLTVGAKHILGWKSPDYVYSAASAARLKVLLTNDKLINDIARNFNNRSWDQYPLTADKYIGWIASMPEEEQVVNLYLSMETFGEFLPESTGIFEFVKALPRYAGAAGISLKKPSEVVSELNPVGELSVPYPLSWADEARDISAWLGNDLQKEASNKLYAVCERVNLCDDRRLKLDWLYLQGADHFYYMSTKKLEDGAVHALFSPYDSPYSAFINYMNVLADFIVRVEEQYPMSIDNEELNSLLLTIRNQAEEIEKLNKEVDTMRKNILEADDFTNSPKGKTSVKKRK